MTEKRSSAAAKPAPEANPPTLADQLREFMAYTHKMFVRAADRVASTPSMDVYILVERATARLARTFAQQMMALKVYRQQAERRESAEPKGIGSGTGTTTGKVPEIDQSIPAAELVH